MTLAHSFLQPSFVQSRAKNRCDNTSRYGLRQGYRSRLLVVEAPWLEQARTPPQFKGVRCRPRVQPRGAQHLERRGSLLLHRSLGGRVALPLGAAQTWKSRDRLASCRWGWNKGFGVSLPHRTYLPLALTSAVGRVQMISNSYLSARRTAK